jgi:hypothetical protein
VTNLERTPTANPRGLSRNDITLFHVNLTQQEENTLQVSHDCDVIDMLIYHFVE